MAKAQRTGLDEVIAHFTELEDPRSPINRQHPLVSVVVIALMGVLAGAGGPTAIARWAKTKQTFLVNVLDLPAGIPGKDVFRRVLMLLKPSAFQACFCKWLQTLRTRATEASGVEQPVLAVDGKTNRRSHDRGNGLGALHSVSIWASEFGLSLGQAACAEKSNEITAIPLLLDQINLTDTIITIDAMGCQKNIVEQIVDGGGDAVIAVKDNQPTLKTAIETHFKEHLERDLEDLRYRFYETRDEGHGRKDERTYYLTKPPRDFGPQEDWPWVKAIGYTLRVTQHADGTETDEVRYYICTRYLSGKRFAEAVRSHWSIESMHWVLDVNFREDDSRTRERILGNNLSWLRRFAITLLKRHPANDSLIGKMKSCMISTAFLTEVLALNQV